MWPDGLSLEMRWSDALICMLLCESQVNSTTVGMPLLCFCVRECIELRRCCCYGLRWFSLDVLRTRLLVTREL